MAEYRPISEFYDAEYSDEPMLRQDVGFFLSHLGGEPKDVLEIGCGTGRAAVPIAAAGHRVVGYDIDEGMLHRLVTDSLSGCQKNWPQRT